MSRAWHSGSTDGRAPADSEKQPGLSFQPAHTPPLMGEVFCLMANSVVFKTRFRRRLVVTAWDSLLTGHCYVPSPDTLQLRCMSWLCHTIRTQQLRLPGGLSIGTRMPTGMCLTNLSLNISKTTRVLPIHALPKVKYEHLSKRKPSTFYPGL